MTTTPYTVQRLREFAAGRTPDGWPPNRMRDITELCDTVTRLQGEADVMRALLRAAHDVIETVDGETAPECEMLQDLQNKIRAAYQGSI